MPSPYDPILTAIGLLEGGKLTPKAKDAYKKEVLGLLATGNIEGKGGSPSTKIFNSIVPLPPISGPEIFNVTTLQSEPLFWFGPDPLALLMAENLTEEQCPIWHTIFVDLLYEKTAVALDMPGTTPLAPVFDVSFAFGIDALPIPFTPPDLALKLGITPVELLLKLPSLIKVSLPKIPIPPIPPPLPDLVLQLPIPPLALLDLCIGLIKLPFDLLLNLLVPKLSLVLDLPGLPKIVLELAMTIVIDLLKSLNLMLIVPKLFIASILIYIKNIVAIVCVDIVGSILGAGTIAKSVGELTGLIVA
jgi:hypothetical protein